MVTKYFAIKTFNHSAELSFKMGILRIGTRNNFAKIAKLCFEEMCFQRFMVESVALMTIQ